jgi:hypothetical protein
MSRHTKDASLYMEMIPIALRISDGRANTVLRVQVEQDTINMVVNSLLDGSVAGKIAQSRSMGCAVFNHLREVRNKTLVQFKHIFSKRQV